MNNAEKQTDRWSSFLSVYIGGKSGLHGARDGSLVVTPAKIVSFTQGPAGEITALRVERDGRRREVAVRSAPLRDQLESIDLSRPGASIVAQGAELLGVLWTVERPSAAIAKRAGRKGESGDGEDTGENVSGGGEEPADGGEGKSGGGEEPADGGENVSGGGEEPADGGEGKSGGGEEPADGGEGKSGGGEEPADAKGSTAKENLDGGAQPMSSGKSGTAPRITARGQAAWTAANKVLVTAEPIEIPAPPLGRITLTPGTAYDKKMLVYAGPLQVYYLDGADLWEAYTPDFVRDMWLSSLAKGAASASWIVPLAKAEFAFITAFFVPWWGVALLSGLQAYAFYRDHRSEIHLAYDAAKRARELWSAFQMRYPTLARKMLVWGLRQTLYSAPDGVELEDIFYFIGRVVGKQGMVGKVEQGIEISLKVIVKVVVEYAVLVGLLHAPKIVGHGLEAAAKKHAAQLVKKLEQHGFEVVLDEARAILVEIGSQPDSDKVMDELKRACQDMAARLGDLMKAYKAEMP
jgi:hypothetical protein